MHERIRRWLCAGTPAEFTLACVHCDYCNVVDAVDLRVQVVDGSPDTYLTVRCENCRKVTPTKVPFDIADKALAGGARLVPFLKIPPIREKNITRFMRDFDAEYEALCEALS